MHLSFCLCFLCRWTDISSFVVSTRTDCRSCRLPFCKDRIPDRRHTRYERAKLFLPELQEERHVHRLCARGGSTDASSLSNPAARLFSSEQCLIEQTDYV
ncbi:hypothetical protein V8C26DRAFT_410310 [Trichoderma gracile]